MKLAPNVVRKKRRLRRSREEIASLLEEYHSSGLSQRAYAQSKGLSLSTLVNWLRLARLGEVDSASRLVAVKVIDRSSPFPQAPSGVFELRLVDGLVLTIPPEFEEHSLRRLLSLLTRPC
jgi:transposase-like protein